MKLILPTKTILYTLIDEFENENKMSIKAGFTKEAILYYPSDYYNKYPILIDEINCYKIMMIELCENIECKYYGNIYKLSDDKYFKILKNKRKNKIFYEKYNKKEKIRHIINININNSKLQIKIINYEKIKREDLIYSYSNIMEKKEIKFINNNNLKYMQLN